jgi:hypothetical protein
MLAELYGDLSYLRKSIDTKILNTDMLEKNHFVEILVKSVIGTETSMIRGCMDSSALIVVYSNDETLSNNTGQIKDDKHTESLITIMQ